uniref:HTH OST-type domain-containing protein n=1 Tax=Anopheles atroparvus TaxID=41427 RepID=A0AAG5DSD0_ANOAO
MNMEELKKIIQAIVISNAGCPMTILQLDKDFKCHEGYNIPYEKYGFQKLDAMLRSMSDAVQTKGQGSSALVLPVITAKSKHIREMVVKHKKNGKKRHAELSGCTVKKGKFEPSERPRANTRDDVVISTAKQNVQIRSANKSNNVVDTSCFTMDELKKLIQAMVISKPGSPLTVAQLAIDFKHHEGTDIPYREYGFQQLDALLRSIPDVVKLDGQGSSALVYPVTSEKSKHINLMIKAQKNNGKKCFNRTAYSTRSTRQSSKQGSNYKFRNGCQSYNVRNDRSSNMHGNGYIFYGANNNHSINPNYGTNRFERNGNLRDTINVPGQSNSPNGYGTNGFDTNRYSENGFNVPNYSYSSNGNNPIWNPGNGYIAPDHFYGPIDCNANRNQRDGYNISSQSYAPNGYGMNDCNTNRYPGDSYNVPNHFYCASNDNNPNWNLGNGYNAPDHFYGPNGCNASRNQLNGYNVPGQSYAWNGYGTNGFNTHRYSGNGYNVPGHSYSLNGNNTNWNLGNGYNAYHGPNGCNANRNHMDGYNVPGQPYASNDCAVNRAEMYAGNSCNIPGNSCAPSGYNPSWNSGDDLHVPGHSYASDSCDACGNSGNSNTPRHSGGTNDSYYAALLGLYREIMGSDVNFPNQGNYLPYNSSGVPALDAMLKPMWDAAQVNLLSDDYCSHGYGNNVFGENYNLSRSAKPYNNNFFITVNLGC